MEITKYIKDMFESNIDTYPDYPKKGIDFKDLSRVYTSDLAMNTIEYLIDKNLINSKADCVIGIESRGYILGTIISRVLNIPFILARKPGKLPGKLLSKDYELEYGTATLQMQEHIISKYKSPIIADDLLATGGTGEAVANILNSLNINVNSFVFIYELIECKGRKKLEKYSENIYSIIKN